MLRAFLFTILLGISGVVRADPASYFYEPGFRLGEKTAADMSAEWWQWAMSIPNTKNPVRDTSGIHCGIGQRGQVWFLAGGFGSSKIRRHCVVPRDVHLFFPIVNTAYWRPRDDHRYTCEQAQASAAMNNETALELYVELDGHPLAAPKAYRAATKKCFNVFARARRAYDAYPSATDGYWVLLRPLPPGEHTLKFSGRYNSPNTPYGRMAQDIEYKLTVR